MLHTPIDELDVVRIDSLAEQQEDIERILPQLRHLERGHESVAQPAKEARFIGRAFNSIDEYIEAANKVSEEDMMVFDMMLSQLRKAEIPPPKDMRRVRTWSEDDGEEVDLDRLKVGKPFWESQRRMNRLGPVTVTIVSDLAASGCRDSNTVGWRGAVGVCLTELLEAAGYRVEFWAVTKLAHYTRDYRNLLLGVCLKTADQTLDLVPTINAVTGWYKRTLSFATYHLTGHKVDPGYGAPQEINKKDMEHFTVDEHVLLSAGVWSEVEAVRLTKKLIESVNKRFGESE